jgi:hypothetical protein
LKNAVVLASSYLMDMLLSIGLIVYIFARDDLGDLFIGKNLDLMFFVGLGLYFLAKLLSYFLFDDRKIQSNLTIFGISILLLSLISGIVFTLTSFNYETSDLIQFMGGNLKINGYIVFYFLTSLLLICLCLFGYFISLCIRNEWQQVIQREESEITSDLKAKYFIIEIIRDVGLISSLIIVMFFIK